VAASPPSLDADASPANAAAAAAVAWLPSWPNTADTVSSATATYWIIDNFLSCLGLHCKKMI
jgi:hypothetical protein